MGRHRCLWCAAVLLAGWAVAQADGALFAVDLGSEFLKVSIIKPGRIPISIVTNEMSKRKTPALVGFVNGERLIGEEAASLEARHPDKIYARLRDWLGKPADDAGMRRVLEESYTPYDIQPAANRSWAAALKTDSGEVYSTEELVASLLEYAQRIARAAADGQPVTDAVLVVPAYFTPAQRTALLDAARLAGINVLSLIHSHAAAALQYGIERDFTNKTEDVVFYDLGHGSAEAALVRFSAYTEKKGGPSISQFEVRDVAWVQHTGGHSLETALVEHFASEFNQKLGGGKDVRSSPKAMAKLRKQVKRTKQILSANSEAPLSVEELFEERDFRSTITREAFEGLAAGFWQQAAAPLVALLSRNNLTSSDLAAVELLGGTSRVPRVKQALSEALGGRSLDMHLDADEAVVLGAGLFAANLSTIFRLRKFGMTDKTPYSIHFRLGDDEAAPEKVLVPALKRMPTKRGIYPSSLTNADSFSVTLTYDNQPCAILPRCQQHFELGRFEVSGISAVVAKYNETGKVGLHTRVDQGGVFHVDRADAALELIEAVPEPAAGNATANETAGGANATANGTAATGSAEGAEQQQEGSKEEPPADKAASSPESAPADAGAKEQDPASAAAAAAAMAKAQRMRKRTIRVPLNLTGGFTTPGMTAEQVSASRRVLRTLRERDEAKRETARAKNDLESHIIAMRAKVEADEALHSVSSEEQRSAFLKQLTEAEDWLYEDGDAASAREYRDRLRALKEVGDPILLRLAEKEARPQAVAAATSFVELVRKATNSWPSIKPWINASEVEELLGKVEDFSKWLAERQEEQAKQAEHEELAFRSDQVNSWVGRLQKAFNRLNNKRRPPPPRPKPAASDGAGNDTAGNETDAGGSSKSSSKAGSSDTGAEAGVEQHGGADEGSDTADHSEL